MRVYIGRGLPGECRSPEQAKGIGRENGAVRMHTIANLDERLLLYGLVDEKRI